AAPLSAARSFPASLDATATLQRHLDRLAPAVAHHAAAVIGPPIPATPPGLLIQRGIASHAMHPLLSTGRAGPRGRSACRPGSAHGRAYPVPSRAMQATVLLGLAILPETGLKTAAARSNMVRRCQWRVLRGGLHPLVPRPAASFPRRPPGAHDVRGLAVDTIRGIHAQGALRHLVD